ncbi:MAG: flavin monoamine oxidase family protein, partial [Geminicoccaceae bacterium]
AWTEPDCHGQPFDHGASFIHAENLNPWTTIARRLGVATRIDPRRRRLFIGARPADDAELQAFLEAREGALSKVLKAAQGARDTSLAQALGESGPFAPQAEVALGPWLLGTDNEAASAADFAATVTGRDRLVEGGYGRLVAAYGRGIPVRFGVIARRIVHKKRHVVVATSAGRLQASVAIVTLPVGVLAAERVRFDPPLPHAKLAALDALPMGLLAKIGLVFEGDPFGLGDTFYLHEQTRDQRAALYMVRPLGQDMVVAFVGGTLARELEAAGEAAAAAFALEPLLRIFGTRLRRRLRGARQTRWASDPFALGSYSVARPGGLAERATLGLPLGERILFAGEAAATDGWAATVAGAHLTGRRAALEALAVLGATPGRAARNFRSISG